MSDFVRENLCVYDPRSDVYEMLQDKDDPRVARSECGFDRCFYGRDRLALHIAELEAENQRLREALTAIRDAAENKAELHPTLLWIADRVNGVLEVGDE